MTVAFSRRVQIFLLTYLLHMAGVSAAHFQAAADLVLRSTRLLHVRRPTPRGVINIARARDVRFIARLIKVSARPSSATVRSAGDNSPST